LKYLSYSIGNSLSINNLENKDFNFEERLRGSLKISAEFLDFEGGSLLIKFYAKETYYNSLAEYYKYYLQLRPYGRIYNSYFNKVKATGKKITSDEVNEIIQVHNTSSIEMADLDPDDINNYPPYVLFDLKNKHKFRR